MNIQLARTFLEIIGAGNFVKAAEKLHVTQSTVSLRIHRLEQELGRQVFVRSKSGVEMTTAGQQFHRYAASLVKVWEEARHQVAIPPGYRDTLVIGGTYSLWDDLLMKWLSAMEAAAPDVAIRVEIGMSDRLMRQMSDGILDIGVMYTPQLRPGVEVDVLFEEQLVLVSTNPDAGPDLDGSYIFVDWGPEFQAAHALRYPEHTNPGTTLACGALGLKYVINNRRSAYFPSRVVKSYLRRGELTLVPDAPDFAYPAYVVYHKHTDPDLLSLSLSALTDIADRQQASAMDWAAGASDTGGPPPQR